MVRGDAAGRGVRKKKKKLEVPGPKAGREFDKSEGESDTSKSKSEVSNSDDDGNNDDVTDSEKTPPEPDVPPCDDSNLELVIEVPPTTPGQEFRKSDSASEGAESDLSSTENEKTK